ncbi:hypothetical protein [Pseudogracilibacillus sp. SO30301A]|uniref:hypothetical protein n=1 Tax=Pseudogracilibacillus sp. SO30301A TaxID=3098291 RepID=UPI00300E5E97
MLEAEEYPESGEIIPATLHFEAYDGYVVEHLLKVLEVDPCYKEKPGWEEHSPIMTATWGLSYSILWRIKETTKKRNN